MNESVHATASMAKRSGVGTGLLRALCAAAGLLAVAGAELPRSLTVFGDSLSDMGNISQFTFGFVPGGQYFNGRFSNGPVYAERLGFELRRSSSGGTNYAFGGARASSSLFDLPSQISAFEGENPGGADPDALFIVWIGGNAVIAGYEDGDRPAAEALIDEGLAALAVALDDLLASGAERIVVPNLPDLGRTPDARAQSSPAAAELASDLSARWNLGLTEILGQRDPAKLELFDVFSLFEELFADPAAFGFTNLEDEAISTPGDDDQFLFWDGVHPTAEAHRILAGRVLAEVSFLQLPPPEVVAIELREEPPEFELQFTSQPGERFRVESSDTLGEDWVVVADDLPAEGEVTRIVVRLADPRPARAFYRVQRLPQP